MSKSIRKLVSLTCKPSVLVLALGILALTLSGCNHDDATKQVDFTQVSGLSCNNDGTLPSDWESGKVIISLLEHDKVISLVTATKFMLTGKYTATASALSLTYQGGVDASGNVAGIENPETKTMEVAKFLGRDKDGSAQIEASGMKLTCIVQQRGQKPAASAAAPAVAKPQEPNAALAPTQDALKAKVGNAVHEVAFLPSEAGTVYDAVAFLSSSNRQKLVSDFAAFHARTGRAIGVQIVKTTAPDHIKAYATKAANAWARVNNSSSTSVFMVIATDNPPELQRINLSVASDLASRFQDDQAQMVISNNIAPRFRKQEYYEGLRDAANSIAETLAPSGARQADSPLVESSVETVASPSFDCAKASKRVELEICASDAVSRADAELDEAYRNRLKTTTDPEALKEEQRGWIREYRDRCKGEKCLLAMYTSRTEVLLNQHKP